MTKFLSCNKKAPLTKQRLSLLIIDIDFMVFHKSLCLTDNPALLANSAIFYKEIEYQARMNAASHYRIDSLIKRVDETVQITLRCYSFGSIFLIGYLIYPWLIILQPFNQ
jgi:hypothetical protein